MQSQGIGKTEVQVNTPGLAKDKKNGLTVTFFIGGKQVDELTPEQTECMAKRLSKTMGAYYTAHSDEYMKI